MSSSAGDHVLVSSMEHNAVMRPLVQLQASGVSFSRIPCSPDGSLLTEAMEEYLEENTKALVLTHASNVCGTMMPLKEAGKFCRKHGIAFIVDAAQTAGVFPVDMEEYAIDALAFTGHKGLLGPQGTGGFLLKEDMIRQAEYAGMVRELPHRPETYHVVTYGCQMNAHDSEKIAGMLEEMGMRPSEKREEADFVIFNTCCVRDKLEEEGRIRVSGKKGIDSRTGVVSIQTLSLDQAEASVLLEEQYGILTRVGLHCAPSAHKTLGTYPTGTIRFSFGFYNTQADVDAALSALEELSRGRA